MPTIRKDNGNKWMARVVVHGKQIACKIFPAGKKYGQAWRLAKTWEDEQKSIAIQSYESEQNQLEFVAFQGEQENLVLKAYHEENNITQKTLIEEQKSLNIPIKHEDLMNNDSKEKETFFQHIEIQESIIEQQEEVQDLNNIKNIQTDISEINQNRVRRRFKVGAENLAPKVENFAISKDEILLKEKISTQEQDNFVLLNNAHLQKNSPLKLEKLIKWGKKYLDHVKRTMSPKTLTEKQAVMKNFYSYCEKEDIKSLDLITPAIAYEFLSEIKDERGGNVANKYRKNLLAAWTWATDFIDGFIQGISPFSKVKNFVTQKQDRYVPPEEDIIKVLQQATGQDLILLLTLYFTGARRGEVFKLRWQDVNLVEEKIRLSDNKAGNGQGRVRWLQMHPELVKALKWWEENRPCQVDNVFMQTHCDSSMGKPFTQRMNFMRNLCEKAGVKEFGFHAIRHKSAAITFAEFGLNAAQNLMGHYRATTTDIYIKSAGLYSNQNEILTALGKNGIGQIAGNLLQTNAIQESYS